MADGFGNDGVNTESQRRRLRKRPRLGGDYSWNDGIPGSHIRNPYPEGYDDIYPGIGNKWYGLIILSFLCWIWGNYYDTSRGVNISIGSDRTCHCECRAECRAEKHRPILAALSPIGEKKRNATPHTTTPPVLQSEKGKSCGVLRSSIFHGFTSSG